MKMNLIPRKKSSIEKTELDNSLYLELYSEEEKELLVKLEELFHDWHELLSKDNKDISFDGFYPGYLEQKVKLLFIGRENRGLSDVNYLGCLYKAIKEGSIGDIHLNRHRFHYMMLYLAYALQKREGDYSKIPYADEISKEFGTKEMSFAFMNLSKFSNEGENSQTVDWSLVTESVKISTQNKIKRNFIYEEIVLLDPDVVITMNLMKYWRDVIADEERTKRIETDGSPDSVASYELKLGEKPVLLLDTYHFSAHNKKDKEDFFDPIMNAIQNNKERFQLKI